VSHEFNHDPEILELCREFGDRAAFMWLEILSLLDRHDNQLKMSNYMLQKLAVVVRKRVPSTLLAFNKCVANGWLEPSQPFARGLLVTYSSPKYAEYHKIKSEIGVPPKLPKLPSLPKKNILKKEYIVQAVNILNFLNTKTHKSFRAYTGENGHEKPTKSLELILARLQDGNTEADLRGVIAMKARKWGQDEKMCEFLRPSTLFGKEKFEQYVGEQPTPEEG
jgi:uncharacterized phage protein (TIGR02220 family)